MKSTQHRRSSQACTTCRQAKLRCDTSITFPKPCSRCAKTGRACTFDPSFRRTPAKGQLDKIKSELHSLQQILAVSESTGVGTSNYKENVVDEPSTNGQSPDNDLANDKFGLQNPDAPEVRPCSLGTVNLTSTDIRTLFNFFIEVQYHLFPIVDTSIPLPTLQKESPLLFWTIIVASSRHLDEYSALSLSLRDPYHELLGKTLVISPMNYDTIQALLLLCHWPFPCRRQPQDPSWNYCGMLISATCQELGFPKTYRWIKLPPKEQCMKARVWLGCFYIATVLSSNIGFPPPIQSAAHLSAVTHFINIARFPPSFTAQIEVQKEVAKYKSFLANDQLSMSMSAIRYFENDLNEISTRFQKSWTPENETALLYAKMNLYILACAHQRKSQQGAHQSVANRVQNTETSLLWIEGLYRACKLIHTCSTMMSPSTQFSHETNNNNLQKPTFCLPKHYPVSMAVAAFFLLDLSRLNIHLSPEDTSMAHTHISLAYDAYTRISTDPLDEAGRTARGIKLISEAGRVGARSQKHHSASIITDALEELPELRGRYSDQASDTVGPSGSVDKGKGVENDVMMAEGEYGLDDTVFFSEFSNWFDLDSWASNNPMLGQDWDFANVDE